MIRTTTCRWDGHRWLHPKCPCLRENADSTNTYKTSTPSTILRVRKNSSRRGSRAEIPEPPWGARWTLSRLESSSSTSSRVWDETRTFYSLPEQNLRYSVEVCSTGTVQVLSSIVNAQCTTETCKNRYLIREFLVKGNPLSTLNPIEEV
jgi:hypothetical protein